jgi:nucleotide-binding universal stress UspA family protein
MKHIIIGTEGSPDATKAVDEALKLAQDLDATVTFVYARTAPFALLGQPFYQRDLDNETAHAREVVGDAMVKAASLGIDADYEIIDGKPADAILDVADTHAADMIVVGSRGLGAVQTALFGSVSKELVTRSTRPVLIVKEPSRQESERDLALVHDGAVLR